MISNLCMCEWLNITVLSWIKIADTNMLQNCWGRWCLHTCTDLPWHMLPHSSGNERFNLASLGSLFTLNFCSYKCFIPWCAQIYVVILCSLDLHKWTAPCLWNHRRLDACQRQDHLNLNSGEENVIRAQIWLCSFISFQWRQK